MIGQIARGSTKELQPVAHSTTPRGATSDARVERRRCVARLALWSMCDARARDARARDDAGRHGAATIRAPERGCGTVDGDGGARGAAGRGCGGGIHATGDE